MFWDITPYGPLKVNRRIGGFACKAPCLPPAFKLVSCSAYSSSLMMEATFFSEMSVDFQALRFPPAFTLVSCSAYSSTLKMEATCCSETLVDLQALRFPPAFTLVYSSAYSSTLKMEAICSSETSVNFQRTTRRYIPEDSTLQT
jgi:hypothetical protein